MTREDLKEHTKMNMRTKFLKKFMMNMMTKKMKLS
eukprot:CAMPEP_0114583098 /NCGR_PEP_ID=MMETSP0125-20121206/6913_1 /TAXON_ID=485358 ORGANISM="Aristerostoma sp., Strain ATCC 50986" /NCGR_SAMPLE_ID=MMETSP0125 /ASSEMBLY_ACC=CAM_ASM_000245 /LENGTH=34 /DNA_ID= /DNA_START= /DNA_END= /DNA_ORIENTATION=